MMNMPLSPLGFNASVCINGRFIITYQMLHIASYPHVVKKLLVRGLLGKRKPKASWEIRLLEHEYVAVADDPPLDDVCLVRREGSLRFTRPQDGHQVVVFRGAD